MIQQRTLMAHNETGEEVRKPTHAHTESSPALSYIHAHKYTHMHLHALHTQRAASPKHVPVLFDVPAHPPPTCQSRTRPHYKLARRGTIAHEKITSERLNSEAGMRQRRCAELRLEAAQTGSGQQMSLQRRQRIGWGKHARAVGTNFEVELVLLPSPPAGHL